MTKPMKTADLLPGQHGKPKAADEDVPKVHPAHPVHPDHGKKPKPTPGPTPEPTPPPVSAGTV